jgi:hypothetical protein
VRSDICIRMAECSIVKKSFGKIPMNYGESADGPGSMGNPNGPSGLAI